MLSRAVNVFRKKKAKKSSSFPGGETDGEDTNASGTETEPDDQSCHSEPVVRASVSAGSSRTLEQSSASSSTECFQDETRPHNRRALKSWTGLRKRSSPKARRDDEPVEEDESSSQGIFGSRSLLSTIRRARSRSRSSAASSVAEQPLPASRSTLSSRSEGACGGVASRHGESDYAQQTVVVNSSSFTSVRSHRRSRERDGGGGEDGVRPGLKSSRSLFPRRIYQFPSVCV